MNEFITCDHNNNQLLSIVQYFINILNNSISIGVPTTNDEREKGKPSVLIALSSVFGLFIPRFFSRNTNRKIVENFLCTIKYKCTNIKRKANKKINELKLTTTTLNFKTGQ